MFGSWFLRRKGEGGKSFDSLVVKKKGWKRKNVLNLFSSSALGFRYVNKNVCLDIRTILSGDSINGALDIERFRACSSYNLLILVEKSIVGAG